MTHLLDTNICSAYLKRPAALAHRFQQYGGGLAIPTVVLAELYTWAFRRAQPEPLLQAIEQDLLRELTLLDFDAASARTYGLIRAELLQTGKVVNPVDLLIAAVSLTHQLTLVTHNVKHFQIIPGLRIADWLSK